MTNTPDFSIETQHNGIICGVDEAGRGPWAGPVVAAAVIWPEREAVPDMLDDSKKLSRVQRDALFPHIMQHAVIGIGEASTTEIDAMNILAATQCAMQRAIADLAQTVDVALIDGNQPPALACQTISVIKGDSKSLSIAAASVIAKVTRDRIMERLAGTHPAYGWERNAGYGTKEHQEALATHGVTEHHRRSFAPIRKLLAEEAA